MQVSLQPEGTVLELSLQDQALAASSSTGNVHLIDANRLAQISYFKAHDQRISQIGQFNRAIYTASLDGSVKMCDPRSLQQVQVGVGKPATCFALEGHALAVGTEMERSEAEIQLWDTRNLSSPTKIFTQIHSEDLSQLIFYSPSVVLSGGVDGLLCWFSTLEPEEDDCLLGSLNVGSSVSRFRLLGSGDAISVLTDDQLFSVWNLSTQDIIKDHGSLLNIRGVNFGLDCVQRGQDTFLFVGNDDGLLGLCQVFPDSLSEIHWLGHRHSDSVRCLAFDEQALFIYIRKRTAGAMIHESLLGFRSWLPMSSTSCNKCRSVCDRGLVGNSTLAALVLWNSA